MTDKCKVAILWRGDRAARDAATAPKNRLVRIFDALAAAGVDAEPCVYDEEFADEVRTQLLKVNGVLVWVDPLTGGKTRAALDSLLRELASAGVFVSADPGTVLKMGTKEVLYQTRQLGWGGDTAIYHDFANFTQEFPSRLFASGPRVLKRYRGNGGQGVWKVSALSQLHHDDPIVKLQEATHRDGTATEMKLSAFMLTCQPYFSGAGRLIDQSFQPRIVEGMVRSYVTGTKLVGFARQYPKGFLDGTSSEDTFGLPAEKTMYGPDEPQFRALRRSLEDESIPQMLSVLGVGEAELPALWDADFLFGPKTSVGADTFVLCEINISCVSPFPDEAPAAIARFVRSRLSLSPSA